MGRLLRLHTDGASKGNPGRAGVGVWITDAEGRTVRTLGRYLGRKTNNEAEYWGLLIGLREARRVGGDDIRAFTDSELMERQINGTYRVKDEKLKSLHRAALEELKGFSSFKIQAVPREQNKEADRLANEAIRRGMEKEKEKGGTEGEEMVARRGPV
jgi:ribonuclease HI